ncbi:MAG TPA: methyltransferase [Thermoplasmata archaeon]|nr:methyltransferase [Thermoplasmata archaeon]
MQDEVPRSSEPYWTERPRSRSTPGERRFLYRGELLRFVVDAGVFSSQGLDPGTSLLIENLRLHDSDRVLDLGCGWGPVGVAAARSTPRGHVVLTEVNRRAARLARQNLERNNVPNAEVRVGPFFEPVAHEVFDVIATNPPYRLGRESILRLLRDAPDHLVPGGRLVFVGKGSQGIRFYQGWLEEHWPGPVEVLGRGSGYRVLEAQRAPGRSVAPA